MAHVCQNDAHMICCNGVGGVGVLGLSEVGPEVGGLGVGTVSTLSKTGFGSRGCVDMGCSTLLQAAFSFRASVRQYDSVNTAGYFGERSRCYLLARNGDLYEVVM